VLHGLTFGATHLGAVHYVAASVPQHLAGTAQALYAAVMSGIAMGAATLLAGRLYASIGGQAYLAMAALALIGLAAALILLRTSAGKAAQGQLRT
jgi:PPP family 3-phenylpropionic acid transporter